MEKKTVFLELPCELIEKIDNLNTMGDRSTFVEDLLKKQLEQDTAEGVDSNTEFTTKMGSRVKGEISLIASDGTPLGTFDINNVDSFELLAKKIEEVSEDPVVRIRTRRWL
jgi:hypothetical protein